MLSNVDLISFFSEHPIDKIVQQGEITIVNDGITSSHVATYQSAKIVTDTALNGYGRAALVRARWSIDNGDSWQSLDSELTYTFTLTSFSVILAGLDSAVSIGCSENLITFRTANGKHGDVAGAGPFTYTPTSRTFIIQYELYERE